MSQDRGPSFPDRDLIHSDLSRLCEVPGLRIVRTATRDRQCSIPSRAATLQRLAKKRARADRPAHPPSSPGPAQCAPHSAPPPAHRSHRSHRSLAPLLRREVRMRHPLSRSPPTYVRTPPSPTPRAGLGRSKAPASQLQSRRGEAPSEAPRSNAPPVRNSEREFATWAPRLTPFRALWGGAREIRSPPVVHMPPTESQLGLLAWIGESMLSPQCVEYSQKGVLCGLLLFRAPQSPSPRILLASLHDWQPCAARS